ncbi:PilZ domain-containing protein [candidate division CSSED10-310 bacterium]|uniref:PilZ domain-containing protein n=1 Tax=candidate division CSSED10-310 bacterium TaxID=2855610 RepID=A0ABV6YRV2_UNCC1
MTDKSDISEKRIHKRFFVEGLVGTMRLATEVKILNLSIGGAAIEADRRLNLGQEYTLKIEDNNKILTLSGKVAWSNLKRFKSFGEGSSLPVYQAGLRFTNVLSDLSFDLLQFISQHTPLKEKRMVSFRFAIGARKSAILKSDFDYEVKRISLGGMLIETDQEFKKDDKYPMELIIGGTPFSFAGRVASCNPVETAGEKRYDIGIAFSNLSQEKTNILIEFIAKL